MENIDYKKLSNAIAFGIVKAFFIFFGIYAILSLILFAIVKIAKPDTSCIHVGGIIDCPNPQGHNISIFGGIPQGMQQ